ncbi:type IV pilus assembly protein PilB [Pseudomonas frederiksbergensis]|jgi:type IV pilus assembly protein PilB|uniref:Type IV pilus assembly protein PilB n=1 Tax=Pseudomonas frederiksbergensis TaxID=104087 RepID=A0A1H4LYJ0_9PSED|nr:MULTISPECIES: type IV-A pilus assembly ATPase PilB [Pseudomonas]PMU08131.1 type IV-A pilus assembly ATPase PilB [Pseudomonas sp. FW305-20]PMU15792.1 type IV-A pilus assembly ATPase PilB [Pseudomonas sp. FW305-122]PMU39837.1 type IV-A pilus assembly ATPase PilB [Pseudomonas sp. FW305-47B]PMX57545.1 type IV-A pilus assembly ATPase PilB [Pseudomonas sp. FW305-33]PMX64301.1 type IV-A pilus assembly ATPase PilB [Pseudomonas sp. FW305-60]
MNDIALSGLAKQLVLAELLTDQSAQQAYQQAQRSRISLISYLVQNKLVKSRQVAEIASEHFGMALLDLNCLDKESQPKGLISEKLIRQHHALPLWRRGNKLFVGVSDPTNQQAINDIQFSTGLNTEAILVEDDKLSDAIEKFFDNQGTGLEDMADVDLDGVDIESIDDNRQDAIAGQDADDAPVVRFVHKMLLDAIKSGSSDLHFEPYEKTYRVRMRTDGILREVAKPPIHLASRIAARLKVMASLDISERRRPQDGRIKMRLSKTKSIDFRVNTLPTLWGEKVVIRILDPSSAQMGIDALGYEQDQKDLYMAALKQPQGMILVTGPTGSGKTVSLYTGLNILNTVDINISTAEDPVEINMEGINQVNVNPKQGMDFAQALRSFLRQDPDVIMVGEIRDLETAEIAIKAAQTGHLVLSTLHTNSAAETLTRLHNMGIPGFNIATSISLIIAQRLARKLCSHCKKPIEIPREALLKEGFPEERIGSFTIYEPVGCDLCNGGYKGRVGIYEVVKNTQDLQRLIMAEGNSLEIDIQMRKDGFNDLRTSGLLKAMQGITSLEEINRVTKD